MKRFRIFLIAAFALAAMLAGSTLFAAGKKAPAPKRPAPRPHAPAHKPVVRPARATKPSVKKPPVAKKPAPKVHKTAEAKVKIPPRKPQPSRLTGQPKLPKEVAKLPRHEPQKNVHRFVKRDERTGEFHFEPRWWYRYVVYPTTVNFNPGSTNFESVEVPADFSTPPPVIKGGQGLPRTRSSDSLAAVLDGMDVENHWLPGQKVNWKTGNPVADAHGPANNCGAFVAAVCARYKVPLALAVEENFVAATQYDWLVKQGESRGWQAVGEVEAQLLANQGWIVIAAWKDTEGSGLSGQTAIVRPDSKAAGDVAKDGPRVVMAGESNHKNIGLKEGFPAKVWESKTVIFLAYRPR